MQSQSSASQLKEEKITQLREKTYASVAKTSAKSVSIAAQSSVAYKNWTLGKGTFRPPTWFVLAPARQRLGARKNIKRSWKNDTSCFNVQDEPLYNYIYVPRATTSKFDTSQLVAAHPAKRKKPLRNKQKKKNVTSLVFKQQAKQKQDKDDYEAMQEAKEAYANDPASYQVRPAHSKCTFIMVKIFGTRNNFSNDTAISKSCAVNFIQENVLYVRIFNEKTSTHDIFDTIFTFLEEDKRKYKCFLGIKEILHSVKCFDLRDLGVSSGFTLELLPIGFEKLSGGGKSCSKLSQSAIDKVQTFAVDFMDLQPKQEQQQKMYLNNSEKRIWIPQLVTFGPLVASSENDNCSTSIMEDIDSFASRKLERKASRLPSEVGKMYTVERVLQILEDKLPKFKKKLKKKRISFTGLSGAGKTRIINDILDELLNGTSMEGFHLASGENIISPRKVRISSAIDNTIRQTHLRLGPMEEVVSTIELANNIISDNLVENKLVSQEKVDFDAPIYDIVVVNGSKRFEHIEFIDGIGDMYGIEEESKRDTESILRDVENDYVLLVSNCVLPTTILSLAKSFERSHSSEPERVAIITHADEATEKAIKYWLIARAQKERAKECDASEYLVVSKDDISPVFNFFDKVNRSFKGQLLQVAMAIRDRLDFYLNRSPFENVVKHENGIKSILDQITIILGLKTDNEDTGRCILSPVYLENLIMSLHSMDPSSSFGHYIILHTKRNIYNSEWDERVGCYLRKTANDCQDEYKRIHTILEMLMLKTCETAASIYSSAFESFLVERFDFIEKNLRSFCVKGEQLHLSADDARIISEYGLRMSKEVVRNTRKQFLSLLVQEQKIHIRCAKQICSSLSGTAELRLKVEDGWHRCMAGLETDILKYSTTCFYEAWGSYPAKMEAVLLNINNQSPFSKGVEEATELLGMLKIALPCTQEICCTPPTVHKSTSVLSIHLPDSKSILHQVNPHETSNYEVLEKIIKPRCVDFDQYAWYIQTPGGDKSLMANLEKHVSFCGFANMYTIRWEGNIIGGNVFNTKY
jgi:hypothetical protein